MLTSLLISIFGLIFKIRLIDDFSKQICLSSKNLFQIKSFLLATTVLILISIDQNIPLFFVTLSLSIIVFLIIVFYDNFVVIKHQQAIHRIVDEIYFSVKTGSSLRAALNIAIQRETGMIRRNFSELYNVLVLEHPNCQSSLLCLVDFYQDLVEFDRTQNKLSEKIRLYRDQLTTFRNFSRRSRVISNQIRLQTLILAVMFSGLFILIVTNYGFQKFSSILFISCVLFLVGGILAFNIGDKIKWRT